MKINNRERLVKLPAAILFDLDNTLYPYNVAHTAAYGAIKAKLMQNFTLSSERCDEIFAQARAEIKSRLNNTASSHSRLLYVQRMLELMGVGSQVLLAMDLEQTYWRTFLSNAQLFAGVKDLLDDIRLLGIPTAIVTDLTAQIQFRKIVYFGLEHYFDYIVTSEESGCDKPGSAPFALALAKIKPQGDDVWMIGDDPVHDIAGAREMINAVTLQKLHDGVELGVGFNTADVIFTEFQELRQLLDDIMINVKA